MPWIISSIHVLSQVYYYLSDGPLGGATPTRSALSAHPGAIGASARQPASANPAMQVGHGVSGQFPIDVLDPDRCPRLRHEPTTQPTNYLIRDDHLSTLRVSQSREACSPPFAKDSMDP